VLEPEVMDSAAEAADYDAMDHSEVNRRFAADLLAFHGSPRGGRWLDVGTGTALIPIELCRQIAGASLLAIDLAEHMLRLAAKNVEAAGFADRIALEKVDAKGLPYPDASFEAVLSNSIVHHIPEPAATLAEMVRLVAPGGSLFVRDLSRPDSPEALAALVEQYAGGEPTHARSMFADSLHAALTPSEIASLIAPLGLPADSVAMTSDRHWTLAWTRPS
jgi:ubiquinone/menaquinone biosynthesis C-methylase UbiE